MQTTKNTIYYFSAAVIFIALKFVFALADNDDLNFLLWPTAKFVGLLTGSHSVYFSETGFYHNKLNILIDKSCSGYNFMLLCFLVFIYLTGKYFDKTSYKILSVPIVLFCAYLLTIFVNTSRIFVSIIVQSQTKFLFAKHQHLLHEGLGIITNLFFLVLTYYTIEKSLIHRKYYEKLT